MFKIGDKVKVTEETGFPFLKGYIGIIVAINNRDRDNIEVLWTNFGKKKYWHDYTRIKHVPLEYIKSRKVK